MSLLKQSIYFFDNFAAPATLRISGNGDTSSLCTGLFSLLLFGFFAYIFAIKSYEVLTYQQVSASSEVEDVIGTVKKGTIMFAMNVFEQHGTLVQNKYFQLYAGVVNKQNQLVKSAKLRLCKLSDFEGVNKKILTDYYDIQRWYCPEEPLDINGVKSDSDFTYINLKIDYCLTQAWCQSVVNIQNYIKATKVTQGFLTAEFIIQDRSFTFTEKQPTVQTVKYLKGTFTETSGIVLDIDLAEFLIQTDKGTFPWKQQHNDTGTYVLQKQHFFSEYDKDYNYLIEANIKFESKTMKVQRAFGKIDDMLSYAGGLFSIIVGFFAYFMNSYNEYRYELKMAEGCFNLDEHGNKVKSTNFHFIQYIAYVYFDWVKTLTCYQMKSCVNAKNIDVTRQEALEQMDIFFLYKKIQYLENMCRYKMSQNEAICLNITEPPCLDQVKSKRLFLQYYDEVTQGEPAVCLQDIYPSQEQSKSLSDEEKKKMLQNLSIQQLQQIVKKYRTSNTQEFERVEQNKLEDQMLDTEVQLSKSFYELQQEKRGLIQGRYPSKEENDGKQKNVNMDTNGELNQSSSKFGFKKMFAKVVPMDSSRELSKRSGISSPKI